MIVYTEYGNMDIKDAEFNFAGFQTVNDCELLRYANMDSITLIEHPIGGKLLDNFLLALDQSGNSKEQIAIKNYRRTLEIKGNITKLRNPAVMKEFFRMCPSTRWKLRIQQNALYSGHNTLNVSIEKYFKEITNELLQKTDIMPIFRQYAYSEIKRRNVVENNKISDEQRSKRRWKLFRIILNLYKKK